MRKEVFNNFFAAKKISFVFFQPFWPVFIEKILSDLEDILSLAINCVRY
jgi:hypothetical protein